MRVRYFDTSVVLSLLLADSRADRALEMWTEDCQRVSSTLLSMEAWGNLHRAALRLPDVTRAVWEREAKIWLRRIESQFYLHEMDSAVQSEIENQRLYGRCRTLDAIHLATSCLLARECSQFELASFDARMQEVGRELNLTVLS